MATATLLGYLLLWALGQGLRQLNLQHLRRHGSEVPAGFEQAVDAARLQRSTAYVLARARLGLWHGVIDGALLLGFVFGGPLGWYDRWVAGLQLPLVLAGLVFFAGLGAAQSLIAVPFDLYGTFRVEARFGFNTTTWRLWLVDLLKGWAIGAVLGAVLVGGGLALVHWLPGLWWAAVWLFLSALSVLLIYLAPVVIEPLFNRYQPVQDPALVERIASLARRAGCAVGRIQQVDASRRSRHSNAYFTGVGRVKRVVLYDTLLEQMRHDEIEAVLAHELGHWKRRHILRRLVVTEGVLLAACVGAWWLSDGPVLPQLVGLEQASLFARLVVLSVLGSMLSALGAPLAAYLSRRHEREADRFAVELIGSGTALARALVKLAAENLANLHPHPLYAALYYSHPPVVQRVAALQAYAGSSSGG